MSKTTMGSTNETLQALKSGNLTVRDIETEFMDTVIDEDPLEHEERNQTMPANAEYSKGGVEHT
jgi:hypothetical protein